MKHKKERKVFARIRQGGKNDRNFKKQYYLVLWKVLQNGFQSASTGHMILLNEIVSLDVSDEFYSMFEVVIQLGAIIAVVILFWNQIWPFGRKDNKEPLAKNGAGAYIKWDIFKLWFHILVSCVPATNRRRTFLMSSWKHYFTIIRQ